jgi:MoxR-like ATPase
LFANIVLADEINRASPKTQSALLEAMQEGQVTIEGETLPLPAPFLVLATQNPIEYEGTFPLPEAQLDRFMLKLTVGYPNMEEEKLILRRRRERKQDEVVLRQITKANQLLEMRDTVETIHVDADLESYIAALVHATRADRRVAVGASPRGSLAFLKMSRANAALEGRDYIIPDDIKRYAVPVLGHRVILQPVFWMASQVTGDVIQDSLNKTPVPVVK